MSQAVAAPAIFLVTIYLVLARPRNLDTGATAGATGALHEGMVLATVVGSDIGPKLTPIGSLATLIWLHSLRLKGLKITWQYYLRVGLVITPPVLLATLGALWLSVRILG